MNPTMWRKALQVIPHVSNDEWRKLDIISKWLISTRAAVLIMTFLSGAFAGIFAFRDGQFDLLKWVLLTVGLIFSHATNNLLNDFTDYNRGVDQDNYYRAQYGPQPLVHGLMTKRQHLTYAAVTGVIALVIGFILVAMTNWWTVLFLALGVFFVLFYTWPLKYIALGEISVLLVWGPLMIGGGYYVITGSWSWMVVLASLPYALGVTGVIFGKHIDKYEMDKERNIHTLPVVIGERNARITLVAMLILQYVLTFGLLVMGFYTLVMAAVVLAIPTLRRIWPMFRAPKPDEKPADYPDVWPNYFVAAAFIHNRSFGIWFMLGLIVDSILKVTILK
ncbi:MAG: ubiquinone biosynthesis protein UbiA [Chloroflexi bacterium RBG_13_48_10]|nr:MAG: ubiquinone biosynthesis protein UbiA [Chloroflexi bacterium RBG_13_48_10]